MPNTHEDHEVVLTCKECHIEWTQKEIDNAVDYDEDRYIMVIATKVCPDCWFEIEYPVL